MLYKKVLLIFGNSHLNAFRRCFDRLIDKSAIDFDIHYVVSGLLNTPWGDFKANNYLRHLVYKDNMAPSIDITSWRYKVDIVLVGMGMAGSGIFTPFGTVRNVPKDEMEKVREYTPKLPLLPDMEFNEDKVPLHTTAMTSEDELRKVYENYYRQKLHKIRNLLVDGRFHQLHWIAEPDMIESVGKFRFGEDLVRSGLYARHRQIGNNVILPLLKEYNFKDKVILHPEKYILSSGLVDDRFRPSVLQADHHVSPEFYRDSSLAVARKLNLPVIEE